MSRSAVAASSSIHSLPVFYSVAQDISLLTRTLSFRLRISGVKAVSMSHPSAYLATSPNILPRLALNQILLHGTTTTASMARRLLGEPGYSDLMDEARRTPLKMTVVAPMVGYSQNRELGVEPTRRSKCRRTSRSKNKRVPPSKERMKKAFRESDAVICFAHNRIGKDIIEICVNAHHLYRG